MNIVFFGTPHFAAHILEYLLQTPHHIVGVVTQPDKPKGRSLKLLPTPVKAMAAKLDPSIPVFQPDKVSTPEMQKLLEELRPDLFLVVGYGEILKSFILDIPKYPSVNIHTSLLPKYRGAAPIQRAILAGEKIIGVTLMEMVKKMDAGDILLQKSQEFNEDDYFQGIESVLCSFAIEMLEEFLQNPEHYFTNKKTQNEKYVSFADKIFPADLVIDWKKSAKEIVNQIRAFSPKPGCFCEVEVNGLKKRLKILSAKSSEENLLVKQIKKISNSSYVIGCAKGSLEVVQAQLEGKKMMSFDAILRGYPSLVIL